jgi:hypothetical protein
MTMRDILLHLSSLLFCSGALAARHHPTCEEQSKLYRYGNQKPVWRIAVFEVLILPSRAIVISRPYPLDMILHGRIWHCAAHAP